MDDTTFLKIIFSGVKIGSKIDIDCQEPKVIPQTYSLIDIIYLHVYKNKMDGTLAILGPFQQYFFHIGKMLG